MNLTIEIENNDDYLFIKKLLESLKGVKIIRNSYETADELPDEVLECIEKYGNSLDARDLLSKDEFFKFVDDEICKLNSRK